MSTTRAGLYVRLSDDRLGEGAAVARQEADCRALATARGWDVAEVYAENDTSAFRRRRVPLPDGTTALRVVRPQFRRLLDDLTAGRIGAVVGYDLDRVARDPRDLEDLIDAAEATGHPVVSVTGSLDLSRDAGITMARVAVAMANQASRDTSRRVRRAKTAAAEQGRWLGGGRRAYGYTPDRTALVPDEAAELRRVADGLLAGGSLLAAVDDLNARGVPTVTGARWHHSPMRRMLTRPMIAGHLEHHGQVVARHALPAVLDEATWLAVRAELASRPSHDTTLVHWLAGVVRCSSCATRMRGNDGAYVCVVARGGCGRRWVSLAAAERVVGLAILARLATAGAAPRRPAQRQSLPDLDRLAQTAALFGAGEITLTEYRAARAAIMATVPASAPAAPQLPAWATSSDIAQRWDELEPRHRQQVAATLLDVVLVHPAPSKRFTPDRLELRWR